MAETVFSKIIRGEIPCHKVYEDDAVLAFLSIHPVNPGHTLVIPKVAVDHFSDLDDATTQQVMAVAQKLSRAIRQVFNPVRVALVVIGEEVPHAHVHLIPYHKQGDVALNAREAAPEDLAAAAVKLKQGL